ncbi:MAG: MATE family efflux transporter [Lachnospiraceae bacterium]|nr:MATE family efflux transporter [Lachnospiraceae bacterium]
MNDKKELFENTPVTKAILTLSVPTIISQLISVIYNIADTFYVGRTGNPYMIAGVSVSLPLFFMTICIANLFGIGGGSLISRMMGAGKESQAKNVSAFGFYGALGFSLLYSFIVYICMDGLLKALGVSSDTVTFANQYTMYVVVLGTPFVVLSAVVAHFLRNVGYSNLASYGLSGGGILNMILDPLFMFVIFPKGQEVLAAAVATLLSNVAAFIFLTFMLVKISHTSPLSISPAYLPGVKKQHIKDTLSVGIPSAVLPGLFDVANIVMNSSMAAHGDLQLAAMGIVMKIERIPNAIGIGISMGMLPLVAYNFSSGNHDRMKKVIRSARIMGLIVAALCVLLLSVFAPTLSGIFLDTSAQATAAAATLLYATAFLRLRCLASPFQFLNYHTSYCMQAMGDGRGTIIHAVVRILCLYIPLMYVLDKIMGQNGLSLALPIGEALADILALYLLHKLPAMKKK